MIKELTSMKRELYSLLVMYGPVVALKNFDIFGFYYALVYMNVNVVESTVKYFLLLFNVHYLHCF